MKQEFGIGQMKDLFALMEVYNHQGKTVEQAIADYRILVKSENVVNKEIPCGDRVDFGCTEKAITDQITKLKEIAFKNKYFELASQLREVEKSCQPIQEDRLREILIAESKGELKISKGKDLLKRHTQEEEIKDLENLLECEENKVALLNKKTNSLEDLLSKIILDTVDKHFTEKDILDAEERVFNDLKQSSFCVTFQTDLMGRDLPYTVSLEFNTFSDYKNSKK